VASVTPVVTDLRTLVNDPNTPSSFNLARGENLQVPQGAAITTNLVFYLSSIPIVATSVYVTQGTTVRTQTGFTVDVTNGLITFSAAPGASGSLPIPFYADYNFNWFLDTDYAAFIADGMRLLGIAANLSGSTIGTNVDENFLPAIYDLAAHYLFKRRAAIYADKYNASGGGQGQDVKSVSEQMASLANKYYQDGIKKRDDYYKRNGQREAPSSHFVNYGIWSGHGRF
jgi:hypothetical protein